MWIRHRYLGAQMPAEPWSFKTLIGLPDTTLNNLVHRFDQVGSLEAQSPHLATDNMQQPRCNMQLARYNAIRVRPGAGCR